MARMVRGMIANHKPDESPKRFDSFTLRQACCALVLMAGRYASIDDPP